MKCQANAALAKAIVKQEQFPDDPGAGEETWWVGAFYERCRLVPKEDADDALHRAYAMQQDLEAQGFKIVEV